MNFHQWCDHFNKDPDAPWSLVEFNKQGEFPSFSNWVPGTYDEELDELVRAQLWDEHMERLRND